MNYLPPSAVLAALLAAAVSSHAATLCTVIADAKDGKVLLEQGDCRTRVTPASTFKIPLALMGFDSGFLKDDHTPALPFRKGYPEWGGDDWRQPTDPERWLKSSVVWYSQQITHKLGAQRLTAYARDFGYGNADFAGDPGKNNGLERAWIISSLKISPLEQVIFLRKLVNRQLPVTPHALDMVDRIVETRPLAGGYTAHGKTGMAYPRKADGEFDMARAYGWFVGWATIGSQRVVFARLDQDTQAHPTSVSVRARDALLADLPSLLQQRSRQ
ncbi:MAG: class D beta-lactamase [Pseudomonadota bacterium]